MRSNPPRPLPHPPTHPPTEDGNIPNMVEHAAAVSSVVVGVQACRQQAETADGWQSGGCGPSKAAWHGQEAPCAPRQTTHIPNHLTTCTPTSQRTPTQVSDAPLHEWPEGAPPTRTGRQTHTRPSPMHAVLPAAPPCRAPPHPPKSRKRPNLVASSRPGWSLASAKMCRVSTPTQVARKPRQKMEVE